MPLASLPDAYLKNQNIIALFIFNVSGMLNAFGVPSRCLFFYFFISASAVC